jgi:hypothetical protein
VKTALILVLTMVVACAFVAMIVYISNRAGTMP